MNDNSDLGFTPAGNMDEAKAHQKLHMANVNHTYFATGFKYTSAEEASANLAFGHTQWKKKCRDTFGDEIFNQKKIRYGGGHNGDFKLTKFFVPNLKDFHVGEKIEIEDNNNIYSGDHKVVAKDETGIIIMIPFAGTSSGTIYNISRRDGCKKAIDKYSNFLTNEQLFTKPLPENAIITNDNPMEPIIKMTKDGVAVETNTDKEKDHIFYDEQGNQYKCLGYNSTIEEATYLDVKNNTEVTGCMCGFYYNDPTIAAAITETPETPVKKGWTLTHTIVLLLIVGGIVALIIHQVKKSKKQS